MLTLRVCEKIVPSFVCTQFDSIKGSLPPHKTESDLKSLIIGSKGDEGKVTATIANWWDNPTVEEPAWETKKVKKSGGESRPGRGGRGDRGGRKPRAEGSAPTGRSGRRGGKSDLLNLSFVNSCVA